MEQDRLAAAGGIFMDGAFFSAKGGRAGRGRRAPGSSLLAHGKARPGSYAAKNTWRRKGQAQARRAFRRFRGGRRAAPAPGAPARVYARRILDPSAAGLAAPAPGAPARACGGELRQGRHPAAAADGRMDRAACRRIRGGDRACAGARRRRAAPGDCAQAMRPASGAAPAAAWKATVLRTAAWRRGAGAGFGADLRRLAGGMRA